MAAVMMHGSCFDGAMAYPTNLYFDSASFFPPAREAVAAMGHAMRESWGNPQALHLTGERAARLLDQARRDVALFVGCSSVEIALAAHGRAALDRGFALALEEARGKSGPLVSSRLEHPHVQALVEEAGARGAEVGWLALPAGAPTAADRELAARASLLVVSAVNHELGTALGSDALPTDGVRLIDAVQAAAWIPLEPWLDARTFVAFSGTKLGAPAAVGVLRAPRSVRDRLTSQKGALEAAPPPWLAAIGLGAACAAREEAREAHLATTRARAAELIAGLRRLDPELRVNGAEDARLGPIVDVSFARVEALSLVTMLGLEGIAISHTATCQVRTREWSPVVRDAYPEDPERAHGATRWSLSEHVRPEEIDAALGTLEPVLTRLRRAPDPPPPPPVRPAERVSPWGDG